MSNEYKKYELRVMGYYPSIEGGELQFRVGDVENNLTMIFSLNTQADDIERWIDSFKFTSQIAIREIEKEAKKRKEIKFKWWHPILAPFAQILDIILGGRL